MSGDDIYPYGMYSCERSVMPESSEVATSFFQIWKFWEQCSLLIISKEANE